MQHAELHVHDMFSVLDGASSPAEYMKRANEIGITHIAQTNHGTNMGHREFLRQAQSAGIVPILGQEAYITHDRFDRRSKAARQDGTTIYNHITLLAQNQQGLENLDTLSRIGWTEGYYYQPRIDLEVLAEYSDGIVALSGCMSGMIAKAIENGDRKAAEQLAQQFKEIFGDRFYIEVMESNSKELNTKLIRVGEKFDIEPVVTSDCHMASKDDLWIAQAMLVINTDPKKFADADKTRAAKMDFLERLDYLYPGRTMDFSKFELFLHTYDEHKANLAKHGIDERALTNTMVIANTVGDYTYYENLSLLPELAGGHEEAMAKLRKKTYDGLADRGMDKVQANIDRIEHELHTIDVLRLANYFLIEEDFVDYAAKNDILTGYGRGSAVSYLTNYALKITKINPMPYNLLPERFISVDREDPADIDTDFAIDGRYQVKKYIEQKYHHVSNIATITYYKDKSALKAAAKVVGVPYALSNRMASKVQTIRDYETHPELAEMRKNYPDLAKLARALVGRIQSTGIHAGGVILSREPIEKYVPVQSSNDPSDPSAGRVAVAAQDMRELAEIGFVKYDLLGLRTLSIVDDCIKMIKERHGITIDIEDIPLDDSNIYEMISAGHTTLLFQAEQSASTRTIMQMGGVSNFDELAASNALVRPGAANSTVGATYMNGKKNGVTKFIHEDARWFTEETYGAILYQEQQLLLCQQIAGMTPAHANKVRKAISKKIPEDLAIWKDEFINGAEKKLGRRLAEAVWKDLEASADYAFAKAHAVGYSMLTLLTAYLKYYYPIEYITAALSRMNSSNKSDRMKMLMYLIEAKRLGIKVRLPHINASGIGIEIQSDEDGDFIRFGLKSIKGIGDKTAKRLIDGAPYNSYAELVELSDTKYSGVTVGHLAALNKVGAAALPDNPRTGDEAENYYTYLNIPSISYELSPEIKSQFTSLIDHDDSSTYITMAMAQQITRKDGWQRVDFVDESASAGIFTGAQDEFITGTLYALLVSNNTVVSYCPMEEVESSVIGKLLFRDGFPDVPGGMYKAIAFNTRITKAGKRMADVVLSDQYKNLTGAIVFPKMYAQAHTYIKPGSVVDLDLQELDDGKYVVNNIL